MCDTLGRCQGWKTGLVLVLLTCTERHAGSWFPSQRLNLYPLQWKRIVLTTGKSLPWHVKDTVHFLSSAECLSRSTLSFTFLNLFPQFFMRWNLSRLYTCLYQEQWQLNGSFYLILDYTWVSANLIQTARTYCMQNIVLGGVANNHS